MSEPKPRFRYRARRRSKFRLWPRWWTKLGEKHFAWLWWLWVWWDGGV